MEKQVGLSMERFVSGLAVAFFALLWCASGGAVTQTVGGAALAFPDIRSIPIEVEGEGGGEHQRFSLILGLGAVSPEYIHGHIVPDPAPEELCPPLSGQPWCGLYQAGAEVFLAPVPKDGYVFDHWTGDLAGAAVPGVVVMDADLHVKAEFTLAAEGEGEPPVEGEQQRFSLMLGLGAVNPEYIHGHILPDPEPEELCPPLAGQPWCGLYQAGAEVFLTPVPKEGYVFDHWTGDLAGDAVPGVVVMDADLHVKAEFTSEAVGEGEPTLEGESPIEGESAEGEVEGEVDDAACGCCGSGKGMKPREAIQRTLGDLLLLGLSALVVFSCAARKRNG